MVNKIIESHQSRLLKRALNIYQKQQVAISKNVAKSNIKGYRRINTDFSHELEIAKTSRMKTNNPRHIFRSNPQGSSDSLNGHNGQKVDLTNEMVDLAVNQIKYEFATRLLNRFYRGITTSITGRIR